MNGLGSFLRKTGLLLLALFCVSVLLPLRLQATENANSTIKAVLVFIFRIVLRKVTLYFE